MSFLEPLLLIGLPLAALPVLIHLINQRRFQNIDWGAMRFLLEANRMSRGFARIRQWLILLFRTLGIAALVFAISRPLARGWMGLAGGGRADTTIILLDRSASMSDEAAGGGETKLETGVTQLAGTLGSLGSSRWVLIDSVSLAPQELASPESLLKSPHARRASASADLPAMLQAASDYIRANRTGQTEIWIVSDLRAADWNATSGKWQSQRDAFTEFRQGVRFHLLAYADEPRGNAAVRVRDVQRVEAAEGPALLLSLAVHRDQVNKTEPTMPVRIEIDGARSEVMLEFDGQDAELANSPLSLSAGKTSGWGRVTIPADSCAADNEFYFVFAEPPPRKTVIVADDREALEPARLAASIAPEIGAKAEAKFVGRGQLASVPWEETALLVWQTQLPDGDDALIVQSFVDRGGRVLFMPPAQPNDTEFAGARWGAWVEPEQPVAANSWRSDEDLLARSAGGTALPVGELSVGRYCKLTGDATALATLAGGDPLLARAVAKRGAVYFCATTPSVDDSTLAVNGVALYAAVQRAIAAGAAELAEAQQVVAGERRSEKTAWRRITGADDALSTEYPSHAGVFAAGERTLAVNRSEAEDRPAVLDDGQVNGLFAGLSFDRVDDRAGSTASITREIWRMFLVAMLVALVVEAALCLPKRSAASPELAGAAL